MESPQHFSPAKEELIQLKAADECPQTPHVEGATNNDADGREDSSKPKLCSWWRDSVRVREDDKGVNGAVEEHESRRDGDDVCIPVSPFSLSHTYADEIDLAVIIREDTKASDTRSFLQTSSFCVAVSEEGSLFVTVMANHVVFVNTMKIFLLTNFNERLSFLPHLLALAEQLRIYGENPDWKREPSPSPYEVINVRAHESEGTNKSSIERLFNDTCQKDIKMTNKDIRVVQTSWQHQYRSLQEYVQPVLERASKYDLNITQIQLEPIDCIELQVKRIRLRAGSTLHAHFHVLDIEFTQWLPWEGKMNMIQMRAAILNRHVYYGYAGV
ncbi:unnamed protein product [Darwinula stevensoni]|uniref:Uncharacterized protein n=1 Tax=Darwinula stevensoni TaxID=69355 RepID=A0A7R9A1U3_9CRUS|nr:unnamed protein product [Darwinula stevensoni]CAG0884333.1 unnamed protein product [Darwinula stevensoni]